jgi:hypothetical protein
MTPDKYVSSHSLASPLLRTDQSRTRRVAGPSFLKSSPCSINHSSTNSPFIPTIREGDGFDVRNGTPHHGTELQVEDDQGEWQRGTGPASVSTEY